MISQLPSLVLSCSESLHEIAILWRILIPTFFYLIFISCIDKRQLIYLCLASTIFYFCLDQVGWGFAWFINGFLIPEIHVKRGCNYTFEVNGGDDETMTGTYHPFYITDVSDGGFLQKTAAERSVRICDSIHLKCL